MSRLDSNAEFFFLAATGGRGGFRRGGSEAAAAVAQVAEVHVSGRAAAPAVVRHKRNSPGVAAGGGEGSATATERRRGDAA